MYDTIIIGQGPAGITAAIYAARREMKTLIIGKEPGVNFNGSANNSFSVFEFF